MEEIELLKMQVKKRNYEMLSMFIMCVLCLYSKSTLGVWV